MTPDESGSPLRFDIDKSRLSTYYFGVAGGLDGFGVMGCSIYGEAFQSSRLASTRHATRHVGKDAKKVFDATNRAKPMWQRGLWCKKRFLTRMAVA